MANINFNGIPSFDKWYSLFLTMKSEVNEQKVYENNKERVKPILIKYGYLEDGDDESKVGDAFSRLLTDVRSDDTKKSEIAKKCMDDMKKK